MLQKLETLRDKLSDLSKSNRSLRLLKLQDKWNFDLAALDQIQTTKHSSTQQIIKRLMSGSTPLYLISNQSEEEIGIKINQQLATLQRNLSAIEEETGLYSVYIGYPFLSGKMTDGTFVQAPIFLFPVRLEKQTEGNNPGWILTRETGEEPTINRTLLLAIQKYCQLKIDDQIYDNAKELAKENLATELCRLLTASGVTTVVDDGAMAKLPEFTQKTIPGVPEGHFTIKTHAVLGHFPQGNSTLLKDYDELIKNIKETTNLGLLEEILLENSSVTEGVSDNTLSLDIDAISHKELYNVTDLDASQEEVILGIDKTNGMVVHGPPGTGKSQVIVNLISRAIAKSQKVMVVCQKRAALDVVYQRLDSVGLADHVALVHDATTDRKQLYQKLEAVLDEKYLHQADTEANDYHKLADKIDAKTTYFNDIAAALWSRQPCELTPFQLYTRSKMLSSNEIMLNLGNLPDTISIERLEKLLTTITTLGNCYGKYGHENYSWVKRTSFATMDNSQRYELTKQLNLALSQSETIEALHKEKYTEYFTPEECWSHSIIIENGVRKVGNYNNGKFLSKLYLWFWVRFNGKPIIEKVAPDGFKDYKSDQWNQLEQRLIHLFKYTEATRTLHDTLVSLAPYLDKGIITNMQESVKSGKSLTALLQALTRDLQRDFNELVEMDNLRDNLDDVDTKLIAILMQELPPVQSDSLGNQWHSAAEKSFYLKWIDQAEAALPVLKAITTSKYEEMLAEYKALLNQKIKITPQCLKAKLVATLLAAKQTKTKQFRELAHQIGKTRRIWPIRKLANEFHQDGLLDIIPVWLVSPEAVSTIFPLKEQMFDLVIFDEASQCPIENGIPAFYRAKKVVVAGDEKQLPPFDLFNVSSGNRNDDEEVDAEDIADSDSLLNLSKRCYPTKLLAWHYRSVHEELINFSNHAFYGGQVEIAPNVTPFADPPAIEWVSVDGLWENQCNLPEAVEVATSLYKLMKEQPDKSVGIITFNRKQQEKIIEAIDQLAASNPDFNALYNTAMSRDIDQRVFIKNIENVQGDERDIILFSVSYAKDRDNKISSQFGSLNLAGGENRLNVAVSRAKEKVIIVCSILPNQLEVSHTKNMGPKLLKRYLEYAFSIATKERASALQVLKAVNPVLNVAASSENISFDSPFEEEVYRALRQQGYDVRTQVGCSGYRIDLAVVDPSDPTRFILGIECDGAMFHSAKSARERDIYRQRFLESKGWKISRIWSKNWWQDPIREIEKIQTVIKSLTNQIAS